MKNKIRMLIAIGFAIGIIFGSNNVALARDTNWTNGRSFSWSPYVSSTSIIDYGDELRARIYFYFDTTGATQNNNMYYFTMEENLDNDGWEGDIRYSNIPDPHFDWDDDNGDGNEEESEVSIEADGWKDSLTAYYNYYFITWWNENGPDGLVYFVAQRSIYNPLNGEYEAYHYDLLTTGSI